MQTIISKLPSAARILLGLVFAFSSITALFGVAAPMQLEGAAAQFMGGLGASGYFFPLLKVTELSAAILLITGIAVPVALVVLAPIVVNIVAFHVFLAPAGLPMAAFVLVAELYLAWSYRDVFAPLFARRRVAATTTQTLADRRQLRAA